ncbi:hypothetical protein QBC37DRAFT_438245 [Rhypophila decipiens]|uniref:Carbonic anhydrase n=1 Tax=Rhypophila decipiens TaxID=261697 RepID=A0AAN6YIE4_9PEZI|nr:hypothetical protein QBC37DRAFT_438245 [Rhypophila decipiens]
MAQQQDTFLYALSSNNAWAGYKAHQNPQFFPKLASGQSPQILWLGCSDSRCPETTILGLQPGDVFVHRNIANIISPTDINTSAVIEYAVAHLKVKHVVLCGHTCCGGAVAALSDTRVGGVLDTWLTPLKAVRFQHEEELSAIKETAARAVRIAELNVQAGVNVLMSNVTVLEAIKERGLEVHGCLFDIACGRIKDLGFGTGKGRIPGVGGGEEVVRGRHAQLIRILLENLTQEDLISFRDVLKTALHEYSTGTQKDSGWKSIHQPERTSIHNDARGTNTLFMPSAGPDGLGIKAQHQDEAKHEAPPIVKPTGAITLFSPQGTVVGLLHASTLTAFRTALASVCLVSKRARVHTLTVFGCGEQAYWHIRLALLLRGSTIRTVNIINRRFSDAAKALLKRLYGVPASVKAREGWTDCAFGVLTQGYGEYERLLTEQVRDADVIFCCTPSTEPLFRPAILTEHEGRQKGRLLVAIGSYTPSMHEIPGEVLHQAVKRHHLGGMFHFKHAMEGGVVIVDTLDGLQEAGELIDAGLEPNQVVEYAFLSVHDEMAAGTESPLHSTDDVAITSEMLGKFDLGSTSSVNTAGETNSIMSAASSSGKMTSSSISSAMSTDNGDADGHAGSEPKHRPAHHKSKSKEKVKENDKESEADRLSRWLAKGNVIYKSVGLGLMDLTVGMHLVKYAQERGVGTTVPGF